MLWHCWLGHLTRKKQSPIWPMCATLSLTQSVNPVIVPSNVQYPSVTMHLGHFQFCAISLLLQSKQSKDELWHRNHHVINKQRMISLVPPMIVHCLIRVFSLITVLLQSVLSSQRHDHIHQTLCGVVDIVLMWVHWTIRLWYLPQLLKCTYILWYFTSVSITADL